MWNLNKTPTMPTYKNPKTIRRLAFTDRLNVEYIVDDSPIEDHVIGNTPTYKDYIANALNPNIDSNKPIYGIAKTLDPLTKRISSMRDSIDKANAGLYNLRKAQQEMADQQQAQQQEVKEDTNNAIPNNAAQAS